MTFVINMKLHDYLDYSPLMPQVNAMHAPPWLYGYYAIIQFLLYGLLKTLGIEKESLNRSATHPAPESCAPQVVKEFG